MDMLPIDNKFTKLVSVHALDGFVFEREKNSVRTGCKLLSVGTQREITPRGPPRHPTVRSRALASLAQATPIGFRKQAATSETSARGLDAGPAA